MQKTALDDVDPDRIGSDSDRYRLAERLGATNVAINRYRVAPGDGFPGGLHAHGDQEEAFVVLEGEATFETYDPRPDESDGADGTDGADGADGANTGEAGEVVVGAGEAIRFAPGEFQSGRNEADGDLVALALGAPRDSEDVRIPVTCPDCGREGLRMDADEEGPLLGCPDCGGERVPEPCPDCGRGDLRVALDDGGRTVVRCPGCGSEFEDAPLGD